MASPVFRYPLTVVITYLWFMLITRLYVKYLLESHSSKSGDWSDGLTDIEMAADLHGVPSIGGNFPKWLGGGGKFSGGGSSGSWGDSVGGSVGDAIGEAASEDVGAIVVVALVAIIGVIIFGSGTYFIWNSPEIIGEGLLQLIMVRGVNRNLKRFPETEWAAHIFKKTVWPVVLVLVFSLALGVAMNKRCPQAESLGEFKSYCWS